MNKGDAIVIIMANLLMFVIGGIGLIDFIRNLAGKYIWGKSGQKPQEQREFLITGISLAGWNQMFE